MSEVPENLVESRVRVRYAETDQMGVVYHANYLVWFEVGRVEFIRHFGMDYRTMEREDGIMIAVVEVSLRYKSPARYDDELAVRTRLVSMRGSIIRFGYQIVRVSDETLLAEGETTHIVVSREMKRAAFPEKYTKLFAHLLHPMG